MKDIKFKIVGTSPLLMHRYPLDPDETKGLAKMMPAQVAEIAAYRNPATKELIMPSINLWRALVSGAKWSKGKGRSTLANIAASCLSVKDPEVSFKTQAYVIDTRSVVNPSTGGRLLSHRPRLDSWELSFTLEYDPEYLSEGDVKKIVADTGVRIGLGDFRVEKKGNCGKFKVA